MDTQDKWYYTIGGRETIGPASLNDLREAVRLGKITGATPVWKSSFGNEWKRAGDVSDFRRLWIEAEDVRRQEIAKTKLSLSPIGVSVKTSIAWTKKVLFQPFSFFAWMGIFCCIWLAWLSPSIQFFDTNTFYSSLSTAKDYSQIASSFAGAVIASMKSVFTPKTLLSWSFSMAFSCFITAFLNVKGRLVFLNKVFMPSQSFNIGWQKSIGKTRSLVIVYSFLFILWHLTLVTSLFQFFLLSGFLDDPSLLSLKTLSKSLSSGPSSQWFFGGLSLLLLISLFRSFFFHFVEPLVYRFSIPAFVALKMALREVPSNLPSFLRFYAVIFIYRCIWALLLMILFFVVSLFFGSVNISALAKNSVPLFLLSQFLWYFILNLVMLPLHFFFRVLGTHFLR